MILKKFFVLLLPLLLSAFVYAQEQSNYLSKVYAPVDANLRSNLAERLRLFVEYQRTQQWEKLYNLTYKPDINEESIDEFVKRQRFFNRKGSSRTLDFTSKVMQNSVEGIKGNFEIEGCLKVRWKKRVHHWQAEANAYLVGGEWYFTGIFTIVAGTDLPPQACK